MRKIWRAAGPATATATAMLAVLAVAACGSSSSSSSSAPPSTTTATASPAANSSGTTLKTTAINGTEVLTNAAGYTLYWFVPDTSTTSKCTGSCATYWPPVKGPATAGTGVTGKLGVITRSNGAMQATYDGHPLYTYVGDTAPGQNKGNDITASGGLWHEMTVSGSTPVTSSTSGAGYGY